MRELEIRSYQVLLSASRGTDLVQVGQADKSVAACLGAGHLPLVAAVLQMESHVPLDYLLTRGVSMAYMYVRYDQWHAWCRACVRA